MFKKNNYGKYQCPCCDYYTLEYGYDNTFELCDVCYWENDGIQLNNRGHKGGANTVSLNDARKNFEKYGASEECFKEHVREPLKNEMPDAV